MAEKWHLVIYGQQPNGHRAWRGLTVHARSAFRAELTGVHVAERWGWTHIWCDASRSRDIFTECGIPLDTTTAKQ